MPGKVNPVIPEYVVGISHKIYSNDMMISTLSAQGCLDLNAYLPFIGHAIIESLKLLISANIAMEKHLFSGLQIDQKTSSEKLFKSPAITTALIPYTGYHKATELANEMKSSNTDIFTANDKLKIIDNKKSPTRRILFNGTRGTSRRGFEKNNPTLLIDTRKISMVTDENVIFVI